MCISNIKTFLELKVNTKESEEALIFRQHASMPARLFLHSIEQIISLKIKG
jgi:hypothetical protein